MPFIVEKDTQACSTDKPWAVKTKDTGKVHGCHATKKEATDQQSALYANVEEASASAAIQEYEIAHMVHTKKMLAAVGREAALPDAVKLEGAGAGPIVLTKIEGVRLVQVGMEFPAATGPITFTFEDLADMVQAASDPTLPRSRVKLGHDDPRFNNNYFFDGEPSFGFLENFRLVNDGYGIDVDLTSVPQWLSAVAPVAWPSRSLEGWFNFEAPSGKTYRFVVTALAMLGVTWPGVVTLPDLPSYYGEEKPADVTVVGGE